MGFRAFAMARMLAEEKTPVNVCCAQAREIWVKMAKNDAEKERYRTAAILKIPHGLLGDITETVWSM